MWPTPFFRFRFPTDQLDNSLLQRLETHLCIIKPIPTKRRISPPKGTYPHQKALQLDTISHNFWIPSCFLHFSILIGQRMVFSQFKKNTPDLLGNSLPTKNTVFFLMRSVQGSRRVLLSRNSPPKSEESGGKGTAQQKKCPACFDETKCNFHQKIKTYTFICHENRLACLMF